jgi:hypothetical protein
LGEVCHIAGASAHGPRYDASQTDEQPELGNSTADVYLRIPRNTRNQFHRSERCRSVRFHVATHTDCHRSRARPHWWPTNFIRVSICHAGALARADKGMSERVGGVPRVDDLQLLPNDPIEALGAHLRRRSGNAASGIFRPAKLTGLKTGARHRASGCSRHENQEFRQCRPPAASNPAAAFTICKQRVRSAASLQVVAVDLRRGNFASSGSITETAALSFTGADR